MKNFKKNQIVIFVIALMLISAGYFNYTSNIEDIATSGDTQYAGIGDAKLVNSNSVESNNEISNAVSENATNTENAISTKETAASSVTTDTNTISTNEINESQETNAKVEDREYFTKSRLERDTMFSQMLESYQKILENNAIALDQKSIAQTEVKRINNLKNAIMICENLIKTKGFEDIIIFVNDQSISVIVKADKLETEKIAQIQNIIVREMNAQIEDVHISNKL